MEIIIQPNAEAASALGAQMIARLLREKPNAVLGLATGSTPLLLYGELVKLHCKGEIDFRHVRTFNLDEYVGLAPDHPQSYHHFMWEHLFSRVNISRENVRIPNGVAKDISGYCACYEEQIRAAGGIDLQLLGLGTDGHIGFNMPTSSFNSRTRIKTITEQTRRDNARFFGSIEAVPHHVITMGMGTIMEARQCLLLAFGVNKAKAVADAVEGPLSAMSPGSVLQMHPMAKLCLDEPAATLLKNLEYYRWVYDNKPDWQKL